MKKLWNVLAVIMVIMLGMGVTSCKNNDNDVAGGSGSGSDSNSSAIVGTWVAKGGKRTATLVFEADGTGSESAYYQGSSNYWWRREGVFTNWKLKGNAVTFTEYWSSINYDGETDSDTRNWTLEYNGTTLTGGPYNDAKVYYKQ